MKKILNSKFALASLALAVFGTPALAGVGQKPGSLLVFPSFDNTRGGLTLLTVTNTNGDFTPVGNLFAGTIDAHFVYVNGRDCQEFNRVRRLTPKDTISVIARWDNPNQVFGYVYVYAKSPATGAAIAFDHLIGSAVTAEAPGGAYEVMPWVYRAGTGLAEGAATDLDSDGRRDLNGLEYEQSPDRIHIPRFLGQDAAFVDTELILISLAGKQFDTVLDFLVYNDNEEVFSAQYSFKCWSRTRLLDISGLFSNLFLLTTNHALNEVFNGGGAFPETGWYSMNGNVATSTAGAIVDPAFLALQIERVTSAGTYATAPFVTGEQANGDLLNLSIFPDTN